jgi:outer membrane immunogenic protein
MKKFLGGVVAFVLLGAGATAIASDMPVQAPAYKAATVVAPFGWAGSYIGLQGGYGWGRSRHTDSTGFDSGSFDVDGGIGGITTGYNWQSGTLVYGYESDTSYTGIDGSKAAPCVTKCSTELHWLSNYRLRAGTVWNQYLAYVTGGLAIGTIKAGDGGSSDTKTRFGWSAGGGIEAALAPKWTAKLEYLYVDLGSKKNYSLAGVPTEASYQGHVVRVGVNYQFSIWDWIMQRR